MKILVLLVLYLLTFQNNVIYLKGNVGLPSDYFVTMTISNYQNFSLNNICIIT